MFRASFSIIFLSFLRILASLIMAVFLFSSSPSVRFSFSASSVRFMYNASSSLASLREMVVLPTHGVPVTRIVCLSIFQLPCLVEEWLGWGNSYWLRLRIVLWAGELVCGFRAPKSVKGLRKLRPRVELQSPLKGQGESL